MDKTSSPYIELGVRFSDFRNAPRLLVHLGLGYKAESNTLLLDSNLISFHLLGSETYKSSSFLIPIHLSYIVFKQNSSEIYTDVGMTFWMTKFDAEMGEFIIDNGEPIPHVINSVFIDRNKMGLSLNLKVGYRNELSEKTRLLVELRGDFLIKNMNLHPLIYYLLYNYLFGTLFVGVKL